MNGTKMAGEEGKERKRMKTTGGETRGVNARDDACEEHKGDTKQRKA